MTIHTVKLTEEEAQACGFALMQARANVAAMRPDEWTRDLGRRLEGAITALDNCDVEEGA